MRTATQTRNRTRPGSPAVPDLTRLRGLRALRVHGRTVIVPYYAPRPVGPTYTVLKEGQGLRRFAAKNAKAVVHVETEDAQFACASLINDDGLNMLIVSSGRNPQLVKVARNRVTDYRVYDRPVGRAA